MDETSRPITRRARVSSAPTHFQLMLMLQALFYERMSIYLNLSMYIPIAIWFIRWWFYYDILCVQSLLTKEERSVFAAYVWRVNFQIPYHSIHHFFVNALCVSQLSTWNIHRWHEEVVVLKRTHETFSIRIVCATCVCSKRLESECRNDKHAVRRNWLRHHYENFTWHVPYFVNHQTMSGKFEKPAADI